MAGYSQTPLVKKLGIKAGQSVAIVNAPEEFLARELRPLPENVKLEPATARGQLDFIMLFVGSAKALHKELPKLKKKLARDGILWVSWPKKSSGVETDLSFGVVQQLGLTIGLVDVKICAVNETWSGLKFVYRLKDRASL
jgi:alkylation response protein AidB-like acyl-CoA dehydrogenase